MTSIPLDRLTLKRRFRRFLGSPVEFDLAPYLARHARIDRLATEAAATDDAGLTAWARRLKTRVGEGASLDQVLDELFALVREASERVLGTRPFDEQIVGGLAMHQGKIARCGDDLHQHGRSRHRHQAGRPQQLRPPGGGGTRRSLRHRHQPPREPPCRTFGQIEITADGVDWEQDELLGPSSTWT